MREELRIAGFGGQGIITIGVLMAKALGQYGDTHIAQTQSYGPEASGGACKTDVVTSDRQIDYIKPVKLDVMAAMSQPSLDAYATSLGDDGTLIVDSPLVSEVLPRSNNVSAIPATFMTEEEIGLRVVANVIMFGTLARITRWADKNACRNTIADTVPPRASEKNYAALDLEYSRAGEEYRARECWNTKARRFCTVTALPPPRSGWPDRLTRPLPPGRNWDYPWW